MTDTLAPVGAARLVTRSFVLVTVCELAFFAGVGVLLPSLPRVVHGELGASNAWIGVLAALYSAAAVGSRPLLAWWAPRFGHRSMVRTGALGGAAATAAMWLAPSVVVLAGLRFVAGVAEALLFVGAAIIVNEQAPVARRAEAASLNSVGVFAGLGLGPVVGRQLAAAGHARAAFLAAGALGLAAAALAFADDADHRPPPADAGSGGTGSGGTGSGGTGSGGTGSGGTGSGGTGSGGTGSGGTGSGDGSSRLLHQLVHPAALATGATLALAMAGYTGWAAFLSLRADQIGGVNDGAVFFFYSALTLAWRLVGARVPERIGLARCVLGALVTLTLALTAATVLTGGAGLWLSAAFMSVGIALLYPSLLALTVNAVDDPRARATVLSSFTMFFEVGGVLGGLVLGGVAGVAGYRAAFGVGAVVTLLGLPVLWCTVIVPIRGGRVA